MKYKMLTMASMLLVSSISLAETCNINVEVGDHMNFAPVAMQVSASKCDSVTLTIKHTGTVPRNAMGHNWVLTLTEDAQGTAQEGWAAGLDNEYLKPDDSRVIASTKVVGGGESDTIAFDFSQLEVGGDYTFFCSFVGHFAIMQGKFTVVE
jgi:azurin